MDEPESTVRIPVHISEGGQVTLLYGDLPIGLLCKKSLGDLILPLCALRHPEWAELLNQRQEFELFPKE